MKGLKIIYCTPRYLDLDVAGDMVADHDVVVSSLNECFNLELRYPGWIAGKIMR